MPRFRRNPFLTLLHAVAFVWLSAGLAQEPPDTNYDESKVPPYELPDPLVCFDGRKVADTAMWRGTRRPEILDAGPPLYAVDGAEKGVSFSTDSLGRVTVIGGKSDPRAAALRKVAESMPHKPDWLDLAIKVEDVALRILAERHPERPLKTNVEYYAAPVLQGVGLTPDLFPATFALSRHAGWTAHVLEQAASNRLIRPDARYVGPAERDLPG